MTDIQTLREELEGQSPRSILKAALQQYDNIAISFSGAEDVVLIEMAHKLTDNLKVFTLDTGRLHPETYDFVERVRKHYGIEIEVLFPDAHEVQDLVNKKGLFSFYEDGHSECCGIRKVNPFAASWRPWTPGSLDSGKTRAPELAMTSRLSRKIPPSRPMKRHW